jgi:hypothetical protein
MYNFSAVQNGNYNLATQNHKREREALKEIKMNGNHLGVQVCGCMVHLRCVVVVEALIGVRGNMRRWHKPFSCSSNAVSSSI